jgi:hypothetical protein
VCFAVLAGAVAGYVSSYDGDYVVVLLLGALFLAGMGFMLSNYRDREESCRIGRQLQRRRENGGCDPVPEELMRRLGALLEQGKISEEKMQRCHDLFVVEPVSDELVSRRWRTVSTII